MTEPADQRSPDEIKAEARRLRRQRQTTKNLVASLVASLGIVAFLVLVVARPDTPVRGEVDYRAVAAEVTAEAPGQLAVPELDDSWSANRADLAVDPRSTEWTVGLLSDSGDFVQLVQIFPRAIDLESYTGAGLESSRTLGSEQPVNWVAVDRSELENAGNYLFVVHTGLDDSTLVLRGTSEAAVTLVATALQQSQPELFDSEG